MIYPLLVFNDWSLLILRLVTAIIFAVHGWSKLKNLKTTRENFSSMGFKPGWLWGTYAAILESAGSILLTVGLGVQIVSVLLAGQIAVAILWKLKNGQKLTGGYELDLLLVGALLALATGGGGAFAFDGLFRFW